MAGNEPRLHEKHIGPFPGTLCRYADCDLAQRGERGERGERGKWRPGSRFRPHYPTRLSQDDARCTRQTPSNYLLLTTYYLLLTTYYLLLTTYYLLLTTHYLLLNTHYFLLTTWKASNGKRVEVNACGCLWLFVVACSCVSLLVVVCGCLWLLVVACGCSWFPEGDERIVQQRVATRAPRNNPKSTQNPPKIDLKSSQSRAKVEPKSIQNRSGAPQEHPRAPNRLNAP